MQTLSTTLDGILDRRVILEQPEVGYRVAIDTVLLASAVRAFTGDRVLDMGCGVGGAMLCLACRVEGISGVGIDILPDLVELCRRNIARNSFASHFEASLADSTALSSGQEGQFDHVMMNPPYHQEKRHDASAHAIKRTANIEKEGDLPLWIRAATIALKPSGTLTLIHRAERLEEILSYLKESYGQVEVFRLLPQEGVEAKRAIVRAQKGGLFFVSQTLSLTLHKADGGYTAETEDILRHCGALGPTR